MNNELGITVHLIGKSVDFGIQSVENLREIIAVKGKIERSKCEGISLPSLDEKVSALSSMCSTLTSARSPIV